MKLELCWAELHNPCFLGGTNLGTKLNGKGGAGYRTGLKMEFDYDTRQMAITWNGETGLVPEANIAMMIDAKQLPVTKPVSVPAVPKPV